MENHTQAISFANSYFALVDGLASGLESQLSKDVVLDWFGRMIKGRKNVAAFMEAHKMNSRHIFSRIVSTTDIVYEKKHWNRKSFHRHSRRESLKRASNVVNDNSGAESFTTETDTYDATMDINGNEIDMKETGVTKDMSYDLSEGDLSNLFKLEISPSNIEEIEQSINRIKLEEEMAPTVKAIKRDCGEEDGHVIVQTSTSKYVEADGEIEFSRKFCKRDIRHAYFSATTNFHTWRRPCKLQIAYSILTECPALEPLCETTCDTVHYEQPKARLPSLAEINEITNRLVPNTNDFGGFLRNIDFFEDRKGFLESLEIEMAKGHCTPLFSPQYVKDKLVFNKPCVNVDICNEKNRKKFVFKYQIHLIIYQDNQKCKRKKLCTNLNE